MAKWPPKNVVRPAPAGQADTAAHPEHETRSAPGDHGVRSAPGKNEVRPTPAEARSALLEHVFRSAPGEDEVWSNPGEQLVTAPPTQHETRSILAAMKQGQLPPGRPALPRQHRSHARRRSAVALTTRGRQHRGMQRGHLQMSQPTQQLRRFVNHNPSLRDMSVQYRNIQLCHSQPSGSRDLWTTTPLCVT